jgi:hypothetical protein
LFLKGINDRDYGLIPEITDDNMDKNGIQKQYVETQNRLRARV